MGECWVCERGGLYLMGCSSFLPLVFVKNLFLLIDFYLIITESNILIKVYEYYMNLIIYEVHIRFL